jgi:hypothetical protein
MTTNTTETIELAEEQIEFMYTYFCALGCARAFQTMFGNEHSLQWAFWTAAGRPIALQGLVLSFSASSEAHWGLKVVNQHLKTLPACVDNPFKFALGEKFSSISSTFQDIDCSEEAIGDFNNAAKLYISAACEEMIEILVSKLPPKGPPLLPAKKG